MSATKKCPMCAEQIPLAAITCEFCGARFEVTVSGYCQTCHKIREADGNGECKVCGNAVVDLRVESKIVEEPIQKPLPESQPIAQTELTKTRKSRLPISILAGILVFVAIAAIIWLGRKSLPVVSGLFVPSTPTATQTFTPTVIPLPSPTDTPEPTPLPGDVIVPINEMASSIPWLPMNQQDALTIFWIGFDINQPPFDNLLVRKAFASALDRQALAQIARENGLINVKPATSFIHPQVLGLDLYTQIGIPFDANRARTLLAQAGYADGVNFPMVTIYTFSSDLDDPLFSAIAQMWEEHLNINVKVKIMDSRRDFVDMLLVNPPSLFRMRWVADFNDPDNFMQVFHTGAMWNISKFSNSRFNQLIDRAAQITNPAERQALYILAERVLCEEEVQIIPLFNFTNGGDNE